jgi:hypothetical protein
MVTATAGTALANYPTAVVALLIYRGVEILFA